MFHLFTFVPIWLRTVLSHNVQHAKHLTSTLTERFTSKYVHEERKRMSTIDIVRLFKRFAAAWDAYFANPHNPLCRRITSRHGPLNTHKFCTTCHLFTLAYHLLTDRQIFEDCINNATCEGRECIFFSPDTLEETLFPLLRTTKFKFAYSFFFSSWPVQVDLFYVSRKLSLQHAYSAKIVQHKFKYLDVQV